MNEAFKIIIFVLAVLNLIPISLSIYKGKKNLALFFALLETVIVALGS